MYSEAAISAGRHLSNVVIQHTSFREALNLVANALAIGNGAGIFAGVRVTAPSGTGKSLMIDCLKKNIIASPYLANELSVIGAELKESPSVSQIQGSLLDNFNYGLSDSGRRVSNNEVHKVLISAMKEHRVQLIVLDEFQHIFSTHGGKAITSVIDWLKRLMNITQVPVLLVGTELMDSLGAVDPQLTSRIPTTIRLEPFAYSVDWVAFLRALAKQCTAVDLSIIHDVEFARKLHEVTKGVLRPLKSILVQATIIAVHIGEKTLTRQGLQEAYRLVYGPDAAKESPFALS